VVIPVVRIDFGMDKLLLPPLALVDDAVMRSTNTSSVSDDRRVNRCNTLNEVLVVDSVQDSEGIEIKVF
jgi:hypothetical protein